jgi:hypothetical protein
VILLATLIAVPLAMRAEPAAASGQAVMQQTTPPGECDATWDCSPPPLLNLDQTYPTPSLYRATPEQRAALRRLEAKAIANVIEAHGLSAGDTAAVQSWGRDQALAELFNLLMNAIDASPRDDDQQDAVDWLTGIAGGQPQSKAALAAQAAGLEYVKWAGLDQATYQSLVNKSSTTQNDLTAFLDDNPQPWIPPHYSTGYCAYRSPEPYASEYTGYNNVNCLAPCSNILGCNPPTPSYEQFVKWGEAVASYQLLTSADYARTAHKAGLATIAGVAAAATAGTQGVYMAGTYAARIAQMAVQSARIAALYTSPLAAAGAVATIVILAIIIAVVQGITVINASQLPGQLAELIIESRTTAPDLKSLAATSDGLTSLLSMFTGATLPAPVHDSCDNSAVTPRGAAFIEGINVMPDDPECLNPSPIPAASPFDPQFLIQADGSSTTTRSATISYQNPGANSTTTARLHKNWFITETNGAVAQTLLFTYRDWDGRDQYGYLLGPDDDGDYNFFSFHLDSDTEFDVDTCVADNLCATSETLKYLGANGTKMSATLDPYVAPTGTPDYASADEGEELSFDANDFKPGNAVGAITYRWRFQDAGCGMPCTAPGTLPASPAYGDPVAGATVTHTWGHSGQFFVELTATDAVGHTGTTTFPVTVGNVPPVLNVGYDARTVSPGTPIGVSGSFDDAGAQSAFRVTIEWGDGSRLSECESPPDRTICTTVGGFVNPSADRASYVLGASHAYSAPGTYYGTVWVSDQSGGTDSETFVATIAGLPSAPGDLSADVAPAAGLGSGQVRLSWSAAASNGEAITDYGIERSSNGVSWTTVPDGVSAATTSILDGGGVLGAWWRVSAVTAKGSGPPSGSIRVTPRFGPHVPEGLTAATSPAAGVGSGQVKLSWGYSPLIGEEEITGYFVEWSVDGTTWTTVPVDAAARSYTVDGLANFTPHRFRVRARNVIGVSPPSEIQATPLLVPDAPAGLRATLAPFGGLDPGQVRLSWAAPTAPIETPVTDYLIEFSADGSTWTRVNDGVSTATTHTMGGLVNDTEYSFRVAARNAHANGAWSPAITATPRWGPGTPVGLAAAVAPTAGMGSEQVKLTWNAPASDWLPIVDYVIEASVDGTTWTTVNDGVSTATTYTVSGLTNGTQYSYRVAARNAFLTGAWTPAITAMPAWVPGAPGGLTTAVAPTAGVGSGQVKLTWTAAASNGAAITDYVIESSVDEGTTWTTVNDGVSPATSYTVSGLTNGTQYSFRVAAKNAVASGAWTAAVLATPLGAPGAPGGLTAAAAPAAGVGSGQVKLTWNPSADNGLAITDYVIESSLNGTTWTTVNDGVSTETTYTVSGLTNGTLYSFRVAGRNAIWISPRSPAIQARPAWADGALVKEQTRSEVYVIFGGAKFHLPLPFWVDRYGGWSNVTVVPDGALATVGTMPREGSVLREWSATAVYLIKNGQKCHITTGTILERYGGWAAVRLVPDLGLFLIPTGPPITS